MTFTPDLEAARDAEIAKIGAQLLDAWRAKLLAGDARAISDLHNCVLDALSVDAAKQLFIDAATGQGGNGFNVLAAKAMADACEIDAIKQVERKEARRVESEREARIERRVFDRLFGGALA